MRKLIGSVVVISVMLFLSGCLDVTTVVEVKKDGAGRIIETVYMSGAMMGMMKTMAGLGGDDFSPDGPFDDIDEEQYKEDAAEKGEGVSFVSAKKVTKPDGSEGVQAVYAFKDINKVQISNMPNDPSGESEDDPGIQDEPIIFKMTKKEKKTRLVISVPQMDISETEKETSKKDESPVKPDNAQARAMAKQMFDGFRFKILVKLVDCEIASSNASYQSPDPVTKKMQNITLIDLNFNEIAKDDSTWDKIISLDDDQEIKSMAQAMEKLKDIEGIKIETAEKITIDIK